MERNTRRGGTSICTVLLLIFLVLKLTGTINWSWWWVLAPLWAPLAIVVFILIIWLITGLLCGLKISIRKKND